MDNNCNFNFAEQQSQTPQADSQRPPQSEPHYQQSYQPQGTAYAQYPPYNPYYAHPRYSPKTVIKGDNKDSVFSCVMLIFSLLAVWLCFWGDFRSGFTISNWIFLIIISLYCRGSGGGTNNKAFPLMCGISAAFISALFTFRFDSTINPIMISGVVCLDCVYFDGMWGRLRSECRDMGIIWDVFNRLFVQPIARLSDTFSAIYGKNKPQGAKKTGKIFIGLCISAPVVFILAILLTNSDAAFSNLLGNIEISLPEFITVIIVGLFFFPFLLSYGFAIRKHSNTDSVKPIKNRHIVDSTIINTVLTAISALYIIYLISQLSYFFGAFSGFLPESYSYSEYARRGFFELCGISAINLLTVFIAGTFTKLAANGKRSRMNKLLCLFICIFTLVIIVTAEAKLIMYIEQYGMTRLRILAACFMIFEAVCILCAVIRIFAERFSFMKPVILAAVVVLATVSIADIDTVVSKYNTDRYLSGRLTEFNIKDINELGSGSTVQLIRLSKAENADINVRDDAQLFICDRIFKYYSTENGKIIPRKKLGLNSFTLSEYNEKKALDKYISENGTEQFLLTYGTDSAEFTDF